MKKKLFNLLALLLVTTMLFNCSLSGGDSRSNEVAATGSRASYDVNRVPSQDVPKTATGETILPSEAPQFIIIGYDDNQFADGMINIMNIYKNLTNPAGSGNPLTYDGAPARASFYCTPAGRDIASGVTWEVDASTVQSWKDAYQQGHEIGNHTWYHEHGLQFTVERWKDEMKKGNDFLVSKVGVPRSEITGFRTPFLEYNPNAFIAMKEIGFEYDNSFEGGRRYWPAEDGSTMYWPYTMDSGRPTGSEGRDFGAVKGLWQMPTDCVLVPNTNTKITGFDYNMWFSNSYTKNEFVEVMKYALNKKYTGNRAPMNFGGHTNYYSDDGFEEMKIYDPASVAKLKTTVAERTAAIKEFLEYALTLPDVRIVTTQQALEWVKNPVKLGTNYIDHAVTVTSGPNGTAAPVGITRVIDGRDLTITVDPASGYMVDTVTVNNAPAVLTNNKYTFTNVKASATFDVTFKVNPNAILHNVTVTSDANGSIDKEGTIVVEQGDNLSLTATGNEGYILDQLLVDNVAVPNPVFPYQLTNIAKDTTVHATFKFVGVTYKMTYYWTYDSKTEPVTPENITVNLQTTDNEVIASVDQALAKRISMEGSGFLPDGRLINLANDYDWPAARFFVVDTTIAPYGYDSQSGPLVPWKTVAVDPTVIPLNSDVYITEFNGLELPDGSFHDGWFKATDTSHSFSGKWIDVFCATYENYQWMIGRVSLDNVTVTHQAGTVYTITPTAGLNGGIWPNTPVEVAEGTDRSVTCYPEAGFEVDQATVNGTPVALINNVHTFKNIQANATFNVTFKPIDPSQMYNVTATAGSNGSVTANKATVKKGESVVFTITPATDFVVNSATLNGSPVDVVNNTYTSSNVQADQVFNVTFKAAPLSPLTADYTVGTQWSTGFGASIVINNVSASESVSNWTVTLVMPEGTTISGWNGIYTQVGNVVTITNTSWNGTIAPGGSVSIGMNGSGSNATPISITVQ